MSGRPTTRVRCNGTRDGAVCGATTYFYADRANEDMALETCHDCGWAGKWEVAPPDAPTKARTPADDSGALAEMAHALTTSGMDTELRRKELDALARVGEILESIPDGAKGRALRYFISFYQTQFTECGKRGEP